MEGKKERGQHPGGGTRDVPSANLSTLSAELFYVLIL